MFSDDRMCFPTIECPWLKSVSVLSYCRMSSLPIECVLLLEHVFSYERMCSLTTECVFLLENVFSRGTAGVGGGQKEASCHHGCHQKTVIQIYSCDVLM